MRKAILWQLHYGRLWEVGKLLLRLNSGFHTFQMTCWLNLTLVGHYEMASLHLEQGTPPLQKALQTKAVGPDTERH